MPERVVEYMALDLIEPAERNAKGHDTALIAASIGRFGYIEPAVLDERTGRLVGGHGRTDELVARRNAGLPPPDGVQLADDGTWLAPVVRGWASANDDEAVAAGIALNRIGEQGGWDYTALHADLAALAAIDHGLLGVGFDVPDLDALLVTGSTEPMFVPKLNADEGLDELAERLSQSRIVLMLDPETFARFRAIEADDDVQRLQRLLDGD